MEWNKRLIIYILTSEEDQMAPIKIIIAYSSFELLLNSRKISLSTVPDTIHSQF